MKPTHLDRLTRTLAREPSRRQVVRGFCAAIVAGMTSGRRSGGEALAAICGDVLIPNQARSSRATFAAAIAYTGGRTLCLRAQANRSASVWQQHDRQHCSADAQPHAQFEHGYNSSL